MAADDHQIVAIPFDGTDRDLFSNFSCGTTKAGLLAAEWIKGPQVLASIRRGNRVWAYIGQDGAVVGFGSIGRATWKIGDDRIDISYIPMLAVAADFQGKPQTDVAEEKYSGQIMTHLISEAKRMSFPLLGLVCDPNNIAAVGLYRTFKFECMPDMADRHGNMRMVRKI